MVHISMRDCYQQWGDGMISAHHTNDGDSDILFDTVEDYLSTLRAASSYNSSAFQWPSESLGYFKCAATALHMSPPNTMVVIKSAKSIPKQLLTYRSSWRPVVEDMNSHSETVADDSDVMEVYHGCPAKTSLHIAASGFKPTIGTGCDDMETNFGLPIGGCSSLGVGSVRATIR